MERAVRWMWVWRGLCGGAGVERGVRWSGCGEGCAVERVWREVCGRGAEGRIGGSLRWSLREWFAGL